MLIKDKHGKRVPVRALIDTGTSGTIILKDFVAPGTGKSYKAPKPTEWSTLGGKFVTRCKARIEFSFPELSDRKKIHYTCHVDEKTKKEHAMYDMILGMDILVEIGMYINTKTCEVVWENDSTPLKERGELSDRNVLHTEYYFNDSSM